MKTSDEPLATPMSKSVVKRLEAQGAPLATKAVQTCVRCGHNRLNEGIDNPTCYAPRHICGDGYCETGICGCHCIFSAPEAQTEREDLPHVSVSAGGELLPCPWCKSKVALNEYGDTFQIRCWGTKQVPHPLIELEETHLPYNADTRGPARGLIIKRWNTRTQPAGEPELLLREVCFRYRQAAPGLGELTKKDRAAANLLIQLEQAIAKAEAAYPIYDTRTSQSAGKDTVTCPVCHDERHQDSMLSYNNEPDAICLTCAGEDDSNTSQPAGSPSDERLRYQVANLIEGVFSGVERQAMPPQQLLVLQENVFIALRAAYHSAPSPTTTDARQRAREIVDAVNKMYDIEPSGDDSCWAEYDRALVNSIASAISSSDKVKQPWQPIETAPKGRAAILVFCPAQHQFGSAIYLVYRFEGENRFRLYASGGRWFSHTPTHWMPLPEPPELSRERINNDHQSHP